ncbi:MAG: GNAT family N-acetyltransferase [Bryobacterales bacterium]|nr:GNAT family N-acetyltransferase [Bryobacterales bacterium]
MDIRLYQPTDREACFAMFDSNLPEYFAPAERDQLGVFLDNLPRGEYYVAEHEGAVIGSGGISLQDDGRPPRLSWGMVHRAWHKNGVGRLLLLYRLRQLSRLEPNAEFVAMNTTPIAQGFFEKLGFRATEVIPDGYGPGLDRVEMIKRLAVCA